MTDIVVRLRAVSAAFLNPDGDLVEALLQSDRDDVAAEAATEIETLRALLNEAKPFVTYVARAPWAIDGINRMDATRLLTRMDLS